MFVRKLSFFRQTGLQKSAQAPYKYICLENGLERVKGLGGWIALPLGCGFFHQGSQQEERFPYKPSSQELVDSIGFGIKCLKTLNYFKSRSKLKILKHKAADDLTIIFAMVPL